MTMIQPADKRIQNVWPVTPIEQEELFNLV